MHSEKFLEGVSSSFRRKPESSFFNVVHNLWTPAFAGGQGFGQSFVLETVSQQMAFPDVALDGNSNAIVVWLQSGGAPPYRVWAKRYSGQTAQLHTRGELMTSFAYRLTIQVRATERHTTPYSDRVLDSVFPGIRI